VTQTDPVGGLLAQISAKLSVMAEIGTSQARETQRMRKQLDASRTVQPVLFRAQGRTTVDSNGYGFFRINPRPAIGHVWEVRSLVVGGVTWGTTAAGTCEVYISGMDLELLVDASPPLTDLIDQATSLPLPSFYSTGQFTVRPPEQIAVRIVGGTSGQEYVATARGIDYQEGLHGQVTEL